MQLAAMIPMTDGEYTREKALSHIDMLAKMMKFQIEERFDELITFQRKLN